MSRKFGALLFLVALCMFGLTVGCGGSPGEIVVDRNAKPTIGQGDGQMDGVEAPDGVGVFN